MIKRKNHPGSYAQTFFLTKSKCVDSRSSILYTVIVVNDVMSWKWAMALRHSAHSFYVYVHRHQHYPPTSDVIIWI